MVVSVPITVLLYNGPLLCGFNVPIEGLKRKHFLPVDTLLLVVCSA